MNNNYATMMDEMTEYSNRQPQLLTEDQHAEFLRGFLGSIGFRERTNADGEAFRFHWNAEAQCYFFPELDPYWTRAGRVSISAEDLSWTRLHTLRMKIATCFAEAVKRDEIHKLIDRDRKPDLRFWLALGGG